MLVGKKNLEVRPIAINKGEIVKRILYHNPDAEFVFCAGDDKVNPCSFSFIIGFMLMCCLRRPTKTCSERFVPSSQAARQAKH